jgi:hypothetical protein
VRGFENERKGALELPENGLDEFGESEAPGTTLRIEDILGKHSDSLGIGIGLELVSTLLQDLPQLGIVGDNTIVDDNEFRVRIRTNGVAITFGRGTVSGPSCMRNGDLSNASFLEIELGSSDLLAKTSNLADFFEILDRSRLIAIDDEASRVISTILLASEASAQYFQDLFAALVKRSISKLQSRTGE